MSIKYAKNTMKSTKSYEPELINEAVIEEVKNYHASYPIYKETDLVGLKDLSNKLGVKGIYVKDESSRFQLNAFKVLGASYAVGKALAEKLGQDISDLPFEVLKKQVHEKLQGIELAATTDGNHGRGVAWMGKHLGLKVHIYMPKGTTPNRLKHITDLGAEAEITELNYDDTVRFVVKKAQAENWLIIQDTAWEGYEEVPRWIMQGYATIAREMFEQLGEEIPTHVFLQAGVGAFAGVIAEALRVHYKEVCPKIYVVEAQAADCYYASALAGKEVKKTGDLSTIMAGLACGEVNPLGYKILMQLTDGFFSTADWVSANGMRILGNPQGDDKKVVSGESGAVGLGLVESLLSDSTYMNIKEEIGLDENSKIMTFSTEGDTDPDVYRQIVWYGYYAKTTREDR